MNTTLSPETLSCTECLDEIFAGQPPTHVSFQLWDGTLWPDDTPRAATLVLKHAGALREMFVHGTEKSLVEAYLRDDFDISGDIEAACELAALFQARPTNDWIKNLKTYYRLRRLPSILPNDERSRSFSDSSEPLHSTARDRQAVSFHYDLSNDFFQLWLDPRMLYSCAYFKSEDVPLDVAQTAKLHYLCRKLRLHPGQRVLDIGCGWGGFALFAAQYYGVRVTGITLSEHQAELAISRVKEMGLSHQIEILRRDYRELKPSEPYDAIVSVGMSEHVGRTELVNYFQTAHEFLIPGGVMLNHAIGEGIRPRRTQGTTFMDEYIFPDSDIPPVPRVLEAAETAGFEVRDVENLREHYALTLRHWRHRLEANRQAALDHVEEETYRAWRLYLAGSAYGFDHLQLAIYQALLSKPDAAGHSHLPLTRNDWYD